MKNTCLIVLFFLLSTKSFAQYQEVETQAPKKEKASGKFKADHLFTGGTLNLGFGSSYTALGIAPFFGYSFNKFVDLAFSPGFNYTSQRDYIAYGDKLRQTMYGPGAFVRLFPFKFIFAQAQYEFNMIRFKYIPPRSSSSPRETYKIDAHSLLVGGGFAGGRDEDNNSYYYISVLWDVGESKNSPYKDNLNRAIPIIRAGYNIALFQGKR